MAQITTRYEAQEWEPLSEGWRIARGRDVRLERTVILVAALKSGISSRRMDEWMTRRSTLVHDRVAVLLDFADTQEAYIAVFEGTGVSIGLPASENTRLLDACLEIADGVQALVDARVPFVFTGGQILWERGAPLLMGVPHSRPEQGALSEREYVREMSRYFGNVMEWQYVARRDNPGSGVIWEQAMRRLKGADGRGPETFVSLRTILQALRVDADMKPESVGPTPQPALAEQGTGPDRMPTRTLPDSAARAVAYRVTDREVRVARQAGSVEQTFATVAASPPDEEEPFTLTAPATVGGRSARRGSALWIGGLALLLLAAVYAGYVILTAPAGGSVNAGPAPQTTGKNGGGSTGNGGKAAQGGGANRGSTSGGGGKAGSPASPGPGAGTSPGAGVTASSGSSGGSLSSAVLSSVVGHSPATAVSMLAGHGVRPAAIRWQTRTGTSGAVTAAAQSGSGVVLTVAAPKGEELIPNLIGMTVSQASAAALAEGFHYSYVLRSDPHAGVGRVFAQSPGAYTYMAPGSSIRFSVAAHY